VLTAVVCVVLCDARLLTIKADVLLAAHDTLLQDVVLDGLEWVGLALALLADLTILVAHIEFALAVQELDPVQDVTLGRGQVAVL